MRFKCQKCAGIISAPDDCLGKNVSCGHCHQTTAAPANRFSPGVVIDDFVIEKEIGHGGMGTVYLAQQISLDRPVALKILLPKFAKNEEFVTQFVREARSAAKLNHPNIVQAYAVGEEDGTFFFAMEYIDGDTMKDELKKAKKIEPAHAAKIIKDIAEALDFAWKEHKIVHHDIKPDNIMVTKSGRAKLADLGLAKAFGELDAVEDEHEVLGTPQYISPEQLLGEPTDVKSDIYSLGATFYHFVTGCFPYVGANATEIAHQHVEGVLTPPIQKEPSLPEEVNRIIVKMMERKFENRYQSAGDLVKDLNNFLENGNKKAVPHLSINTSFVPKVGTASVPLNIKLNTTQSVPKIAPKLELSKPNDTPKLVPGTPEQSGKTPEKPPATPAAAKNAPAQKNQKKNTKKNDKKSDKSYSNLPKIILISVMLLLIGGGVCGYLYFKEIKKFSLDFYQKITAEKKSEPIKVPARPPVKTLPRLLPVTPEVPVDPRKDFIPMANAMLGFINENPEKELEFIYRVDSFLTKFPTYENNEEQKIFDRVIEKYNRIDEKLRVNPIRETLMATHQREIETRVLAEQQKIAEAERRRVENERIAAERAAQQARENAWKKEQEALRRKILERANQYKNKIEVEYPKLCNAFMDAVKNPDETSKLKELGSTLNTRYPLPFQPDDIETKALDNCKKFADDLLKQLPETQKMYNIVTAKRGGLVGLRFELGTELVVVSANELDKRNFKLKSLFSKKTYDFSMDDEANREKLFKAAARRLEIENLPFYYDLFSGASNQTLKRQAPNSFWKKYLDLK